MQLYFDFAVVQMQAATSAPGLVMKAFKAKSLELGVSGNHCFKIFAPLGHESGEQNFQLPVFFVMPALEKEIDYQAAKPGDDGAADHPQVEKSGRGKTGAEDVDDIQRDDQDKA